MGRKITQNITKFHKGMTNAYRTEDTRFARNIEHFDIQSAEGKMILSRGMENDTFDGAVDTVKLTKYIAGNNGTADRIYGLGVVSGTSRAKIFERNTVTDSWSASATAEVGGTARSEKLFVLYKDSSSNPVLWGARDGSELWGYDTANNNFETEISLSYTDIAQGVVHPYDDILYVPYDNKIAKNDAGSWTNVAFTLHYNSIVTSITPYGNSLAIATKPKYAGGESTLSMWTRDSSVNTSVIEEVNWGSERLQFIEEIDGVIIGISDNITDTISASDKKLIFKVWQSGMAGPRKVLEIPLASSTISYAGKQKTGSRMYFMASLNALNVFGISTQYDGVWSFGRNSDGSWGLSKEFTLNDSTDIDTPVVKGFLLFGNWLLASYTETSSPVTVSKISTSSGFFKNTTGVWESTILNSGDSSITKKLKGVTLSFEPIPQNNTYTLKYAKDGEVAYTTIFTYNPVITAGSFIVGRAYTITTAGTTDFTLIGASNSAVDTRFVATGVGTGTGTATERAISRSAVNIESTGDNLPEYKEITFRIEVSGAGVGGEAPVITALSYTAEEKDDKIYG